MNAPFFRTFPPGIQLLFFMLLHILGFGAAEVFAYLMAKSFWDVNLLTQPEALYDFSDSAVMALHRALMILVCLLAFILPVLLFRRFMELSDQDFLYTAKRLSFRWIITIMILFVCAYPVINALQAINHSIDLQAWFGRLGTKLTEIDEQTLRFSLRLLASTQVHNLIANLAVVALVTAIAEELFFRAVMLRIFAKLFKNVHVAVWIGAFVFSAYHLQFTGFIPRFYMGVLLGYLFIVTGNIWSSVLLHFMNNAFIVVLYWMYAKGYEVNTIENFGMQGTGYWIAWMAAIAIAVWIIIRWRKERVYQTESEMLFR